MYALKYGTAPLVRATGGLKDTVAEFDLESGTGNGFMFDEYRADAMVNAIARARRLFADRAAWGRLMDNCFAADFSWIVSAGVTCDGSMICVAHAAADSEPRRGLC